MGGAWLAPATHLDKTYHVQIGAVADAALLDSITKGVRIDDGSFLGPKSAHILRIGEKNSWLEIVLDEGKNRHIRRMLAALGINVLRLLRIAIGPLTLGDLPKGASQRLADVDKRALDRAMRQNSVVSEANQGRRSGTRPR